MQRIKQLSVIAVALVCLCCLLPFSVYANSAPPIPYYEFILTGLPKDAVYADLLIKLPESDPDYVALVSANLPDAFFSSI